MDDDCVLDGILDSLEVVGYTGPLREEDALLSAVEVGLGSSSYVDLIMSLCSELKSLLKTQESVTRPTGPEDADSFQLEARAFLCELSCPHPSLTDGLTCLASYTTQLLLIDFLLSELLATRLLACRTTPSQDDSELLHSVPRNLLSIIKVYGFSQPPPHVAVRQIFDKIILKTRECVGKLPEGHLGSSLVVQPLSEEQWATLDRINETLTKEYSVRRQMLLTRCDVTVQSFKWSERIKGKEDEFERAYQSQRSTLKPSAPINIARVLAAKDDLLAVQRTSSGDVRGATQCAINKVLIGKVPDRGGRPQETRPPPDMPAFRGRTEAPQERRDGGHKSGKRGGRGGRVQSGWSGGRGGGRHGGGWQHHGGYHGGRAGGQQQYHYS